MQTARNDEIQTIAIVDRATLAEVASISDAPEYRIPAPPAGLVIKTNKR